MQQGGGSETIKKDTGKKDGSPLGTKNPSLMGGRVSVTTKSEADEVTSRRAANLVGKKLVKCPVCKVSHLYEKVWTNVVPQYQTKMMSTHLMTCPKFVAMTGTQRLASVNAHAACLYCAAWDHVKHRLPGGRDEGELKCKLKVGSGECGGNHGLWYHDETNLVCQD